ncbi:MAG: ABC transporter substrate-binding protein [Deltaproteobacteria bacterium]|nr:ABC transporter substrate-binding protein [Deltaproteobacteria bacterium]
MFHRYMHGVFFSVFCLMAVALLVIPAGVQAQQIVIAQGIDAQALDPQADVNIPTMVVNSNIFDALLSRDRSLKIINRLATSYKVLGPNKWRFNLRKGVEFHNGEPFDAECVKYTFERIFAPGSKSTQKGWFNTIDRVEIVDKYTVDFITKKPDPILPARLTMFYIVPPKYCSEAGFVKFNLHPVGTGPFEFVKWIRDNKVVLKRNEKYWDGPSPIKELVFRSMPETQARVAGLQTGEIDIATYIPPDLAEPLKGKGDFTFKSTISSRIIHLKLSTIADSPLKNKKVRQAVNYAIDRESIIKHILKGYGEIIPSFVPKIIWGHNPNAKAYTYDPKKARKLLKEAGFPNGVSITMNGPSGRYMRDKEVCQAIAGQLADAGIRVNLQILEWGTLIEKVTSHTIAPIYLFGWSLPSLDPDQWLWPNLHSNEPMSQTSYAPLDELLEQARHEMDVKKREQLYFKAQDMVNEEALIVTLYEQKDLFGVSKKLEWSPRGDEMIYMRDAKLVK